MSRQANIGSHPPEHRRSFDSLRLGRSSQTIHARLLRFWDTPNTLNSNDILGITMVLIDEMDSLINAYIPAECTKPHRQSLQEGQIYEVAHFEVESCPYLYKTTEHTFVIRFIAQTALRQLINRTPVISEQKFMLRKSDHLHMLANTNLELPDVVGVIKSVKGFGLMSSEIISPVLINFLIAPNVQVYLSLLDEAAAKFKSILNSENSTNSVMVVTSINPEKKEGDIYLHSTAATRFYFGNNIAAVAEFKLSLTEGVNENLPVLNAETAITTKELDPPGDLNMFLSNSSTQDTYFTCIARVVEVSVRHGWFCLSCTTCGKELDNPPTAHPCDQCHDTNSTAVVRYKVQLLVDDGDNIATFLVLDKEMMKLTKQDAATLLADEVSRGLGNILPKCLAELQGNSFVCHVHVTADKFKDNAPTFTVCRINEIASKEKTQVEYGESSGSTAATYMSTNAASDPLT